MADHTTYLPDVTKYHAEMQEAHVKGIVRHLGIALKSRDSSLVACSDPKEREGLREGFLKKKLGLTQPDAELDAAIESVCQQMKDDRSKERVTFCYLLAKHFGKLEMFA